VNEREGALYVYGVVAGSDRDIVSATGVKGSAIRTVGRSGVAALVSDLDARTITAPREIRAHWRVLEEASKRATVLPVRFGTVMESERAVCEHLLEPNAGRLEGLLRELAGRVQLCVKGDYDQERLLRDVVRTSPAVATLRERLRTLPEDAGYYERIRLGELVAAEVGRRREQDSGLALEKLEPLAVSARAEEVASAEAAFNLAFLVERDGLDGFSAAVGELAHVLGERVRLRYVGPLPPYSFAGENLTVAST
jgi:Gas vesicle synthesis protein GvpL/GvpF